MAKKIRTYEQLAELLGANEPTEYSINRRLYKDTKYGVSAQFATKNLTVDYKERWHIKLRPSIAGVFVVGIRVGGKWYADEWFAPQEVKLPEDLAEFLSLQENVSNNLNIAHTYQIGDLSWNKMQESVKDFPNCKLHGMVLTVLLPRQRIAGKKIGVAFNAGIEGTEQTTQEHCVWFPCEPYQIWATIRAVEEEADDIWMETHGCAWCWDWFYQETDGLTDDDLEERWSPGKAVDSECPKCKGKGVVF